jgi:hypothetical protein
MLRIFERGLIVPLLLLHGTSVYAGPLIYSFTGKGYRELILVSYRLTLYINSDCLCRLIHIVCVD